MEENQSAHGKDERVHHEKNNSVKLFTNVHPSRINALHCFYSMGNFGALPKAALVISLVQEFSVLL